MDYYLERRVALTEDSEFKNLYRWSLQELDEAGTKLGGDQIPWAYSLDFGATDLTVHDQFRIEPNYGAAKGDAWTTSRERRFIKATLTPSGSGMNRRVAFSMFGTSRRISDFVLQVDALATTSLRPTAGSGAGFPTRPTSTSATRRSTIPA